jgi:hypothetical protein
MLRTGKDKTNTYIYNNKKRKILSRERRKSGLVTMEKDPSNFNQMSTFLFFSKSFDATCQMTIGGSTLIFRALLQSKKIMKNNDRPLATTSDHNTHTKKRFSAREGSPLRGTVNEGWT